MMIDAMIQRLTSSIPMHPLPVLINQGVHVVLSSDDPAVFGNMGLTFDFYQVGMATCSPQLWLSPHRCLLPVK